MKKNFNVLKKFKINFGPQWSQQNSDHLVCIRALGVFSFGIQVEVPDTIAIGLGVAGGVAVFAFLFYQYLKKRTPEKKNCEQKNCTRAPTDAHTLESSLFDVIGIVKLQEGYVGVTKEKFFYFLADIFNHDLPTLDLSYFTYHEVASVLKFLGKQSSEFENYCKFNKCTRVNPAVLALLDCFLKKHIVLYPILSNGFCLHHKDCWTKYLQGRKDLPTYSYLRNLLTRYRK
jgi:hypothetical protein